MVMNLINVQVCPRIHRIHPNMNHKINGYIMSKIQGYSVKRVQFPLSDSLLVHNMKKSILTPAEIQGP